ncbi:aminopeptidase [Acutalibacter sp. 1XD8-33]|uniref:aminopeptidase C n=1 Tax=Acutalibacter sp. 1XD8-33 TaxID=2320081 RepID=UPI000EA3AD8C|nr:C1 family peptidase [Acutalibacter sp. 1XD8-33]RKJ40511.1 aminopeptidase [Acutalibacter sp. 1XD8-33]
MNRSIEAAQLESFESDFQRDPAKRVAQLAVTSNGVNKSATDPFVQREDRHQFSVQLETGKITNQKGSGRCWMFAALNTMRVEVMRRLNLEHFELSQNYTLFYDKLEKSNYFLETILDTLDEPTNGRLIAHLLQAPLNDGGQWDMLCNLVEKYGVVPKDAMPETACSSSTWEVTSYMTRKLREFACVLREGHAAGKTAEQLRNQKEVMLCNIYNMLCIAFGNPPKTFTLEVRDKDKKFIRDEGLTGRTFFEKYVGWDMGDYVSLINATTADKPFHRTFTVKMLGNIVEGRPVKYLNLPIEDLKAAAIRQMQDNQPVWFGCDVGKCSIREGGIMDLEALRADQLFGTEFGMNKAQRLDYGDSMMTHAMVFQGVNLDESGKPTRWRVENSWGKEAGVDGYYVMSDDWFNEYTYQVVVHKKYLTEEQRAELEQAPIELEPWDPMGSLA